MAGNAIFQTDFDGLNMAILRLQEKLDAAKSEYTALVNDIETINASWSGGAHTAFMNTLYADRDELNRIITELQNYISDFSYARNEYARAEEEINNMVNTLIL